MEGGVRGSSQECACFTWVVFVAGKQRWREGSVLGLPAERCGREAGSDTARPQGHWTSGPLGLGYFGNPSPGSLWVFSGL